MPSDPSILKRKRSGPSEWWAAAPTSNATQAPPQEDEPRSKKRGRHSTSDAERVIQEAPAAGNRGKRAKSVAQADTENAEDEGGEVSKPLRRGRSSNTEAELVAAAVLATEIEGANKKKRGRPAQSARKENRAVAKSMRPGRSSNTEVELKATADAEEDELVKEPVEAAPQLKKRGRPAASRERAEPVDEVIEAPAVPKKRGRRAAVRPEEPQNDELSTSDRVNGGNRRRTRSTSRAEEREALPLEIDEIAEAANPSRRGRSSNTQDKIQATAEMPIKPQPDAKKRGRRPKAADALKDQPVKGDEAAKPTRRGRPSNNDVEVRAAAESSIKELNVQKKRGKVAKTDTEPPAFVARPAKGVVNEKRTRQSDPEISELAASGSVAKDVVGRTGRGRRSGTVIDIEAATSSLAKERNVRQKGDVPSKNTNVKAREGSPAVQGASKSKRRAHPPTADIEDQNESHPRRKEAKHSVHDPTKRKHKEVEELNENPFDFKRRRRERESQQETAPQIKERPTYRHLSPVTRRVSRQAIEEKWAPLPSSCIEIVAQLLQDLQRPVLVPLNDERKRTEAHKVMQMVLRRITSKFSKGLKFPPGNHLEEDFDFEKILDSSRALESQLTPALHANELLESEVAKEKARLESEEAALADLETNAKTEAARRKDAGRRVHSLLLSNDPIVERDGINDHIELAADYSILPFTHTEDEDLQDIAKELNGHLDSIQGNISRVNGISQAMAKSRAAVQATLFGHLEIDQFEDIVLG